MTLIWSSSAGALALQSPTANDPLLDMNTQPSLDLQFAATKSLTDQMSDRDLIDFTRDASGTNSAGTYVDSDGLIKTSAVNLLTYSEEFDNAFYQKDAGVSVTPDAIQSPSGVLSADLVDVPGNGRIYANNTSVTGVCSVYIKAGTFSHFVISGGQVDLTVPSNSAGTITPVGDGWYRVVSNERTTVRHFQVQAYPDNTYSIHSTPGSYYLWGAQLETGSTANTYIPTTNLPSAAPRFDHDPVTGESLGLLIEESRENLLTYSEEFDNAAWATGGANVTPNTFSSPNGTTTADKLVATNTTGSHYIFKVASVAASQYTVTVFSKSAEKEWFAINVFNGSTYEKYSFNVSTGEIGIVPVGETSSIEPFVDGWYRCTATYTSTVAGNNTIHFHVYDGESTETFQGDGTSGIYLWGAQLEAGSFPTSYIPTSGSTVTRAADVASITGTNFSRWYNQSEGTIYASFRSSKPSAASYGPFVISDGTSNNRLAGVNNITNTNAEFFIVSSGATEARLSFTDAGEAISSASAYKLNDCGFSVNGGAALTDTSVTIPTVNQLGIGYFFPGNSASNTINGTISRLTYYPYRLGDTKLQEITS